MWLLSFSRAGREGLAARFESYSSLRTTGNQIYASMPEFALMLLSSVDRPIVDQTGLTGRYDFQLKWTIDDADGTDPDAPPGLFTAIQEQIGLKLEPVKAPADVLVVDSRERPGAN